MTIITVQEPETGKIMELKIHPVKNFTFPGWVILIPGKRNILLFRKEERWHTIPENISPLYAEKIAEKLTKLAL
ncbi:hypothetical protein ACFFGT_04720 [Mucilaginibacter angelicae]|uniref:Nudix hydrolase domain-containing protein n=1 Tax=Mucilaginibacter angelicae TaxID=869718 RepID=A0ABV6L1A7_9SPHI